MVSASLLRHNVFVLCPAEFLMKEEKTTAPHRDLLGGSVNLRVQLLRASSLPPSSPTHSRGPQSCVKFIILYLTMFKWLPPALSDSSKTHLSRMSSVSWKFAEFKSVPCLTGLTEAVKQRERREKEKDSHEKVAVNTIRPFQSHRKCGGTLWKHK